jgi:hypothetical protein
MWVFYHEGKGLAQIAIRSISSSVIWSLVRS